jgi:predicted AlkP superfamily pyrophosphatase or phosphodiesterase
MFDTTDGQQGNASLDIGRHAAEIAVAGESSDSLLPCALPVEHVPRRPLGFADWSGIALCLLLAGVVLYRALFVGPTGVSSSDDARDITARFPPVAPTILISIDGFRHDYIDRTDKNGDFIAPTLREIRQRGVSAGIGMQPVMPSLTFPNHNSLVTGLFPESSKIVSNTMYSPRTGRWWHMSEDDPSWWGGEPIWVTLRRTPRRGIQNTSSEEMTNGNSSRNMSATSNYTTGVVFWPGSSVEGRRPNIYSTYNGSTSYSARVSRVISLLSGTALDLNGQRADFVAVYFEGVDHAGHEHGTRSPQLTAEIAKVDASIAEIWRQAPGVNLIVVSDHGSTFLFLEILDPDRNSP